MPRSLTRSCTHAQAPLNYGQRSLRPRVPGQPQRRGVRGAGARGAGPHGVIATRSNSGAQIEEASHIKSRAHGTRLRAGQQARHDWFLDWPKMT